MCRSLPLLAVIGVLFVLPLVTLAQTVPTPAIAAPVADPADAVTTSDRVIQSQPVLIQAPLQPAEGLPTTVAESQPIPAPGIVPPAQVEVLPGHVVQQPVPAPAQQPLVVYPHTLSELIRANSNARRHLHDAQTAQERAFRDRHRAERDQFEMQMRMLPVGSYSRSTMSHQQRDLRRQQDRAEDYLDDYNDEQRRQLLAMHRRQEATFRSQLSVQSFTTVHVGVPQTTVMLHPVVVPAPTSVRVYTRRGFWRRGSVNVVGPRGAIHVGW